MMGQPAVFRRAADVLDAAGLVWWLSDGSVLGAVRQGTFLASDADVDLGFWDVDRTKVVEAFTAAGWSRYKSGDLKFVQDRVKIDLHGHVRTGDHVWFSLGGHRFRYVFSADLFHRFDQTKFEGRTVNIPAPTDRYLEEHYGADWRTPRPRWRWDSDPPCLIEAMDLGVVTAAWGSYGRFLPDWVESIRVQPWAPSQVTVVDCGMDDPAPGYRALKASGLKFRWITEPYRGMGHARNVAVQHTDTEWVSHLDADDRYLPSAFDDVLALHRNADVVGLGAQWKGRARLCKSTARDILRGETPPLSPSVFRRSLWEQRPYITANDYIESALWLGFAHLGARFVHTTRPAFVYRDHPNSHSATLRRSERDEARRQYRSLRAHWEPPQAKTRLSVAIMAHPKRAEWAEELAYTLGCEIVWDRGQGLWDTARRTLEAFDPDADYHVVVQDDAILSARFFESVREAVIAAGTHPLGLFIGSGYPSGDRGKLGLLAQETADAGGTWVVGRGPLWAVAHAHPVATLPKVISLAETFRVKADDDKLTRAYRSMNVDCWYPVPSLVDHREGPSLLNNPRQDRTAVRFIGDDTFSPFNGSEPDDAALSDLFVGLDPAEWVTFRRESGSKRRVKMGSARCLRMAADPAWQLEVADGVR